MLIISLQVCTGLLTYKYSLMEVLNIAVQYITYIGHLRHYNINTDRNARKAVHCSITLCYVWFLK